MLDGQAEVFGRELPHIETVIFYRGENLAIFSWKGAKIEVEDPPNILHSTNGYGSISDNKSPMRELVNINHILEQ